MSDEVGGVVIHYNEYELLNQTRAGGGQGQVTLIFGVCILRLTRTGLFGLSVRGGNSLGFMHSFAQKSSRLGG